MRFKIQHLLTLTFILHICSYSYASFELSGNQTRYVGMGGTSAAYVDDSAALMTNPAGLALLSDMHATVEYAHFFGIKDLTSGIFASKHTFGNHALGIGLQTFGNKLYREQNMSFGYATHVTDDVFLGLSVRYYHLSIERYGSTGVFSVDAGLIARLHPRVQWGVFSHNINKSRIGSHDEAIPQIFSTGIFCQPSEDIGLAIELVKDVLFPVSTRFGIEYKWLNRLYLRAGFMMQPDQVTFGSGFQFSHFRIGYAGQYHQELGLTHQFAVSLSRVNTKSKSIIKTNVPTATTISSTENIIININTATEAELQQLDGVGPTLARRIVVYRHVNGPFRSLEDFDNVKGVGKKLIERNKNRIVFE